MFQGRGMTEEGLGSGFEVCEKDGEVLILFFPQRFWLIKEMRPHCFEFRA